MTNEELTRLLELAGKATPGPWFSDTVAGWVYAMLTPLTRFIVAQTESGTEEEQAANAQLIAAVPTLITELLEHRKRDEGQDISTAPSRERLGQLIYEAVYASQGGKWSAVETRDVWFEKADWFLEQLRGGVL